MTRSERHAGLLPESYRSGARTWNSEASRSINALHCPALLAFEWMHTTPSPEPASRKDNAPSFIWSRSPVITMQGPSVNSVRGVERGSRRGNDARGITRRERRGRPRYSMPRFSAKPSRGRPRGQIRMRLAGALLGRQKPLDRQVALAGVVVEAEHAAPSRQVRQLLRDRGERRTGGDADEHPLFARRAASH